MLRGAGATEKVPEKWLYVSYTWTRGKLAVPDVAQEASCATTSAQNISTRTQGGEHRHGDQATGSRDTKRDRPPRTREIRSDLSQDAGLLGFTIIATIKPGRAETIRGYGATLAKALEADPYLLAPLKLHYLRWVLFDNDTRFMYQGIFDTDFDKYTEDAIALFTKSGVNTVFENLEGFPMDWKTNPEAFIKFVRDHQCPSFIEYGEYPYVSADEIKKALRIKNALSEMLDQLQ
jgi:hypothetical protein